jgi:hypothetical protein
LTDDAVSCIVRPAVDALHVDARQTAPHKSKRSVSRRWNFHGIGIFPWARRLCTKYFRRFRLRVLGVSMAAAVLSWSAKTPIVDSAARGPTRARRTTLALLREGSLSTDLSRGLRKVLEEDLLGGVHLGAEQASRFEEVRSTLEDLTVRHLRSVPGHSWRATDSRKVARQAFLDVLEATGEQPASLEQALEWMQEQPALVAAALIEHHIGTLQSRVSGLFEEYRTR